LIELAAYVFGHGNQPLVSSRVSPSRYQQPLFIHGPLVRLAAILNRAASDRDAITKAVPQHHLTQMGVRRFVLFGGALSS
jgi:hypothetical protein